jgi:hypothetical protein
MVAKPLNVPSDEYKALRMTEAEYLTFSLPYRIKQGRRRYRKGDLNGITSRQQILQQRHA